MIRIDDDNPLQTSLTCFGKKFPHTGHVIRQNLMERKRQFAVTLKQNNRQPKLMQIGALLKINVRTGDQKAIEPLQIRFQFPPVSERIVGNEADPAAGCPQALDQPDARNAQQTRNLHILELLPDRTTDVQNLSRRGLRRIDKRTASLPAVNQRLPYQTICRLMSCTERNTEVPGQLPARQNRSPRLQFPLQNILTQPGGNLQISNGSFHGF